MRFRRRRRRRALRRPEIYRRSQDLMPTDSTEPTPLAAIHGIGPKVAGLLGKLGLITHDDLLHFVPRRYEDRRHLAPLGSAEVGQTMTVRGKIHSAKSTRWRG